LHASDLHLELPLEGVAHVPASLRELFRDAPYRAALRLFDHALADQVDFVVLAGDVIDFDTCGSRGLAWLVEQFERLKSAGIGVYWSSGVAEMSTSMPVEVRWPANVKLFWSSRPADAVHCRSDGTPVAHIVAQGRSDDGCIRPESFWPHAAGLPSIAIIHGRIDTAALASRGIHYWALGGRHEAATLLESPTVVHYPGTIQGRGPSQVGMHGCTLVEWSPDGLPRTVPIACDAARWSRLDVTVDPQTTREQLQRTMKDRVAQMSAVDPSVPLLVSWQVRGDGPLASQLRRGRLAAEILGWLRSEFGSRSPDVWSVALDVDTPPPRIPDEHDETMLGFYLRTIDEMTTRADSDRLDLSAYLGEAESAESHHARLPDAAAETRILRQAALLGIDLLAGEETHS
jgi:hypothetical protein